MNVGDILGELGSEGGLAALGRFVRGIAREPKELTAFLGRLGDLDESLSSLLQQQELVRLYGHIAEVLEELAVPYLPLLVGALQGKLRAGLPQLHEALAESFGDLVHNTMHTFPELSSSCECLDRVLAGLFEHFHCSNRTVQAGAGLCIAKIVQYSPIECIYYMLSPLVQKTLEALAAPTTKAHGPLLEALTGLVTSAEGKFTAYVDSTVPVVLGCLQQHDGLTKKAAVEALAALMDSAPDAMRPLSQRVTSAIAQHQNDNSLVLRECVGETLACLALLGVPEDGVLRGRFASISASSQEQVVEFQAVQKSTVSELSYMNQRLSSIEEMVSAMSQLFDARIKQLLANPAISKLLH